MRVKSLSTGEAAKPDDKTLLILYSLVSKTYHVHLMCMCDIQGKNQYWAISC